MDSRIYALRLKGSVYQQYKEVEWEVNESMLSFLLRIRDSFSVSDGNSFVLEDITGCVVVLNNSLPSGKYDVIITQSCESITRIIGNEYINSTTAQHNDNHTYNNDDDQYDATPFLKSSVKQHHNAKPSLLPSLTTGDGRYDHENFELSLLRTTCGDTLIANERTWLAWTRTSLNIMICCFTFIFLNDWNKATLTAKIATNIVIVCFSLAFLCCFIVGYVRYKLFVRLLRLTPFESNLHCINDYDDRILKYFVLFLGLLLACSSVLYIGVLSADIKSSVGITDAS